MAHLLGVRGVRPRVVRRVAVDDEAPSEARPARGEASRNGQRTQAQCRSSSRSASGVFHGEARKASRSTCGLTPAWTNSTSCERQCGTKGFEPAAHALGQRDPDERQNFLRAARRDVEIGELPNRRRPAVTQPVGEGVERVVPRRPRIERQAHHRLVIAHQRDLLVGADSFARACSEVDRSQAVGAAVHEVAEKDDGPPLPSLRLVRSLIEQRMQEIGPAMNVADGEHLDARARPRAAKHTFPD